MTINKPLTVYSFNKASNLNNWYQINDGVMGGVSNSKMILNENGHGIFTGNISLKNNGGFAMTRLPIDLKITNDYKKIILKIRGDGKDYQIRIKSNSTQMYWYIHPLKTTTESQKIEIPLKDFYPSFRGVRLNLENFSSDIIKEIAILIGNKKEEAFKLIIEEIIIN